ncbi:MAG: transposase, partial [Anaerolineae bacterium]|nr:transposase [Anaerolineae bacterium]
MLTLPAEIMVVMEAFAPVFSQRIWDRVQEMVIGAILAPGRRTVTSLLRVLGLQGDRQFQNYHRVLNRAQWSGLEVSAILLRMLVSAFVPADGEIVMGGDDTLERRRGARIAGLGCFRDAARSTQRNKVKSMGLRWLSLMLLTEMPWSRRIWALPFLTVLAP